MHASHRIDHLIWPVAQVFPSETQDAPTERHEAVLTNAVTSLRALARVIRGAVEFDRESEFRIREVGSRAQPAIHIDHELRRGHWQVGSVQKLAKVRLENALGWAI